MFAMQNPPPVKQPSSDPDPETGMEAAGFENSFEGFELLARGLNRVATKLDRRAKKLDLRAKELDRRAEELEEDEALLCEFIHSHSACGGTIVYIWDFWTFYETLLAINLAVALFLCICDWNFAVLDLPVAALVLYFPVAFLGSHHVCQRVLGNLPSSDFGIFVAVFMIQLVASTVSMFSFTHHTIGIINSPTASGKGFVKLFLPVIGCCHAVFMLAHCFALMCNYDLYETAKENAAGLKTVTNGSRADSEGKTVSER